MNKKMTLLAGAISSVLSGAALADINDIIITEYVEGSASNKAVEISNIGTSNYTFDGTLSLYYSSYKNVIKNSKGQNVLEGITLAPGKSIVVVNGDSSTELRQYVERLGGKDALVVAGTYDQVQHSAMNFNGDDAVWLGVSSDASGVKDIFGNYGHSGDKIWADQTMRRKSGSKPATTYQESEWEKLSINAFGGLGHPTDVNDEPLPPPPANLPCTDAEGTVSYKTIGEVQGEAYSSPLIESGYTSKEEYLVTGVVSAVATSLVKGFYLYDDNADGNVKTSDGVFVKTSGAVSKDMIGQQICVRAKVNEDYGMTTLLPTDDIWEVKNSAQVAVEPVSLVRIDSDDTFRSTLERLEGMLVKTSADMGKTALELAAIEALVEQVTVERVDGEDEKTYEARLEAAKKARTDELIAEKYDMRVSRTFSFDYSAKRNNMVIAYKRPNPQLNQDHVAGSDAAKAQTAQNKDYRIVVESDEKPADGKIPYYPEFASDPSSV